MNDEKVISAIRNRDEIAISEVITRYSRLLWKTAGAVLNQIGSVQDIEECVADTFICLWEHPDRYDPRRGKLKTWLSIVARTQAVNRCREITKRRIVSLDDASFLYQADILDGVLQQEAQHKLTASINALEEPAREILIRRYYYEQKPKEIARALHMNVKTGQQQPLPCQMPAQTGYFRRNGGIKIGRFQKTEFTEYSVNFPAEDRRQPAASKKTWSASKNGSHYDCCPDMRIDNDCLCL